MTRNEVQEEEVCFWSHKNSSTYAFNVNKLWMYAAYIMYTFFYVLLLLFNTKHFFFVILKTKTLPDMKNNINNFKQIPSFFFYIIVIIIIIIEQCIYKLHKIQVYCVSVCISEELKRNIKIACNAYSQRVLCFNKGSCACWVLFGEWDK